MRRFFETVLHFLREADMLLLALSIISTVYGILLISSAVRNSDAGGVSVQIVAFVLGLILFVLFSYIDIDVIADKSIFLLVFSALFIVTLFFWGVGDELGQRAWLRFLGIGIQPSEIVKITFIIIIARMITNHQDRKTLNSPLAVLQILLTFGILFGLIILSSSDFGSALVYLFILIVMLFIGGLKLRWFLLGGGLLAGLTPLIWKYVLADYHRARILAPFDPSIDETGLTWMWQVNQSRLAIASGGFSGQGLFNGRMTQTPGAIPVQQSDFIFSVAGEELGFIGCLLIILLLVMIIVRCIVVGVRSNDSLGLLVCTGVAAMIISQTIENIGMCLGLLPVVGLTLPFFSYGGSSIITCFAAMGIVSGIKMRPRPVRFRSI